MKNVCTAQSEHQFGVAEEKCVSITISLVAQIEITILNGNNLSFILRIVYYVCHQIVLFYERNHDKSTLLKSILFMRSMK